MRDGYYALTPAGKAAWQRIFEPPARPAIMPERVVHNTIAERERLRAAQLRMADDLTYGHGWPD